MKLRHLTGAFIVFPCFLFSATYHSEAVDVQALLDKGLNPGDAVIMEGRSTLTVRKPLKEVTFVGGSANWIFQADVIDCDFIKHSPSGIQQLGGKLRRSLFLISDYGAGNVDLTHADSVVFYFNMNYFNPSKGKPKFNLHGFVRNVTFHKFRSQAENNFSQEWAPNIRIDATDPVGDGTGTYILSPIFWRQTNWLPIHVVRGKGIVLAHLNTEYNRWSDAVIRVDNGQGCYLLCNGVGAGTEAHNAQYKTQPVMIKYPTHEEPGHGEPPFRGAAYMMGGLNNKSVASGSYKTWSIGVKAWLPALHYADGISARDPFFEDWAPQSGKVQVHWADPKGYIDYSDDGMAFLGAQRYPVDGPDIPAPYFKRLPKNIPTKGVSKVGGALAKEASVFGPDQMQGIESALASGKTVQLAAGTFHFSGTLRNGRLVGKGVDSTVLVFPAKVAAATDAFLGYENLTVTGGSWGFVNTGYVLGREFIRVKFDGNSEGGILINDNTQNDNIQDAEFWNSKFGIKTGTNSNKVDPNVDKLDIVNCHFENLSEKGIYLQTDPEKVKNGQVAVLGCSFKNIGGAAIHIQGTQTHLVQRAEVVDACTQSTDRAAIHVDSYKNGGAVAITHCTVRATKAMSGATAVAFGGMGAVSHIDIEGYDKGVQILGQNAVVEHVKSPAGILEIASGVHVYLARSEFSNAKAGIGDMSVRLYQGSTFQEKQGSKLVIDSTPPSPVNSVRVTRKQNDPKYPHHRDFNLIEWDPVAAPPSGLLGYAVFAKGVEIGRTDFLRPPEDLMGVSSQVAANFFMDTNTSNQQSDYQVKPINGAYIFPDGKQAPIRQWTRATGYFETPDGVEFRVDKVDYKGDQTRMVTDATRGLTINASENGKLANGVFPVYVKSGWGPISGEPLGTISMDIVRPAKAPGTQVHWSRGAFVLQSGAMVELSLWDLKGRRLEILHRGFWAAGLQRPPVPENAGSGIHFLKLKVSGQGDFIVPWMAQRP